MFRFRHRYIGVKAMLILFAIFFYFNLVNAAFLTDSTSGDNLGDHKALQNIELNNFWLSGDGGNEGIFVTSGGNVGIGTSIPSQKLQIDGSVSATSFIGNASTATALASNGANCSVGYYPLGVNASGAAESCTLDSDIYWTGTATNLNAATGRTSLGLGSLATLSSVTSAHITDDTIVNADISSSAAIAASKIQYGSYFITSAGTSGQVWTSDGSGAGIWADVPSGGGISGSGSSDYVARWIGSSSLGTGTLYDNGTNVGIGTVAPNSKLHVNGASGSNAFRVQISGATKLLLGSGGGLAVGANQTPPSNGLYIYGNIGVGVTSPAQRIHSAGYIRGDTGFCIGTSCITSWPSTQDIYWTGTATNLNASTGRTSLGLGSLATLSSVTSAYITDGTIVNADISSSAAIAASKIQYGSYFITSAGTSGQVWTSDGSGAGIWSTVSTGGDNLGDHSATQNIKLNTYWLSGDGGNEGIYVNSVGNVGIGTALPDYKLHVNGTAFSDGWYTTSDEKYKINVEELDGVLLKINNLRGVSFSWDRVNFPDKDFPQERELGFIAQEIEKEFPEIVRTDSNGYKSVMYDRFSAILLEAIKEQQKEINSLTNRLKAIEKKLGN